MSIAVDRDVAYLGEGRAERLDLYLPCATRWPGRRPVVIVLHGGGWRAGDKADARERAAGEFLAAHGYAAAAVNYRLNKSETTSDGGVRHTEVAWPGNLADCEAALDWVMARACPAHGLDARRIAMLGFSAGGHLALLLAARRSLELRAVVDFYGVGWIEGHRVAAFAGATEAESAKRAREASPALRVHSLFPPVLLVHGETDALVPVREARRLRDHLYGRGLRCEYLEIPGAPHGFGLGEPDGEIAKGVLRFLERHMLDAG